MNPPHSDPNGTGAPSGATAHLGPFRILAELGRGGMGVVYRARDTRLNREVALKVLLPKLATDSKAKARFLREARAQAAVEHDHIIPIHEVSEDPNGGAYIVMPLLRGRTLGAELEQNARLPLAEALRIAREIAEGLAAAHAAGLIHRDIKPANVWLEGDRRRVKILDFGLARAATDTPDQPTTGAGAFGDTANVQLTVTGAVVGTPAYMSPEQARGRAVDHRSDVFSLGVLLYELATGQRPFDGPNPAVLLYHVCHAPAVPASARVPDLPPELDVLIGRMLAKDPAARPQTCAEVAAALAALVPTPVGAPPSRYRWPALALALVALVLGLWAVMRPKSALPGATAPERPGADRIATPSWWPAKGLALDHTGKVAFAGFKANLKTPLTLEAFVTVAPEQRPTAINRSCVYFFNLYGIGWNADRWTALVYHRQVHPKWETRTASAPALSGRRTHVAATLDAERVRLFVDGRSADTQPVEPTARLFDLSFDFGLGAECACVLEEVRVSNVVRYTDRFAPVERHTPDAHTLALYPLDQTEGETVRDTSGNGRDGTAVGFRWVAARRE